MTRRFALSLRRFLLKGLAEGGVEIVTVGKVARRVFLGLSQYALCHQVENYVTYVFAAGQAPRVQHGLGKGAVLLDRILAHSFQQFRAADVAAEGALAIQHLHRVRQGLLDKAVGFRGESWVFLDQVSDNIVVIRLFHAICPIIP